MMTDYGARCDRHVGEVFAPRCYECAALQMYVRPAPVENPTPVDNSTHDLVADALASWGLSPERTP